jgi:hypothetical protein
MSRWRALENEVQEIFVSALPLDAERLRFVRERVFPRLGVGMAAGLDPTDKTFTGSFSLRTGTAGADGSLVAVGGMLRLEADVAQNRYRVTIRSKHMLVSEGMRDCLKLVL